MRDVIILQPSWGGSLLKQFLKNDKITDKIFFYDSIQSYFILVFSAWHVSLGYCSRKSVVLYLVLDHYNSIS